MMVKRFLLRISKSNLRDQLMRVQLKRRFRTQEEMWNQCKHKRSLIKMITPVEFLMNSMPLVKITR